MHTAASAAENVIENRNRFSLAVAALALLAAASGVGCNRLKARNLLNEGVLAVEAGQNDKGIEDFKQARVLDPGLLNAQVYLAVAYANEYSPNGPSEENARIGQQAVIEFQNVLAVAPNDMRAIDGLGKLYLQMADYPFDPMKYQQAKQYYLKHIALKQDDSEPYYQVGAIDWILAHYANNDMRKAYNLKNPYKQLRESDPLPADLRAQFSQQYVSMVEEGLQMMGKALSLKPDYEAAISYEGLLLRQKADESENGAREALLKQADGYAQKVNEIKQKQADTPSKS